MTRQMTGRSPFVFLVMSGSHMFASRAELAAGRDLPYELRTSFEASYCDQYGFGLGPCCHWRKRSAQSGRRMSVTTLTLLLPCS